jgi:hypothetical protein
MCRLIQNYYLPVNIEISLKIIYLCYRENLLLSRVISKYSKHMKSSARSLYPA